MNQKQIQQMMKQVQQMQSQMAEAQEALADETVEGTAGGGMVKATMTGTGTMTAVEISPQVVDPDDVEMLQDLVLAAINDATRKSQELQAERLGGVTGGLGDMLGPGMPGMLGG